MNNSARRYKSKLKRKLQCSRATKAKFLNEFSHSLDGFLDENPDASFNDLSDAFGPPEEMANILMDKVDAQEKRTYRLCQLLMYIVIVLLAIVLALTTISVFFWKEKPVTRETDISTSNEFVVTDTHIKGE